MKKLFGLITVITLAFSSCAKSNTSTEKDPEMNTNVKIDSIKAEGYKYDTFLTPNGREVDIVFIKHGSLILDVDNYLIYIDPVGMFGNDFSVLPKADMILVTHEHHDHFDADVINEIKSDSTRLIMSRRVTELFGNGEPAEPGDSLYVEPADFSLTFTPAYNISPDHLQFHPVERKDIGFVFDIDGLRIYVAGDTEDIPDMASLKDIDVAFLPVNQPYTMTPEQAIHAIEMLRAGRENGREGRLIVYPYHYGETDLAPLVERFADTDVDIRIRQMQ